MANAGRLIVVESKVLDVGEEYDLDSRPLTVGRGAQNDVSIDGDEFASARHVRIESRRDGVWVSDVGSTNGTYVNGVRIESGPMQRFGAKGAGTSVYFRDPDGSLMEFMSYAGDMK